MAPRTKPTSVGRTAAAKAKPTTKAPPQEAKKRGRPSTFDQAIADELCERIADGDSLRTICREDKMPRRSTVFRWLAADTTFRDQYAHACDVRTDELFDQMLEIADTPRIGTKTMYKATGIETTEADMIEHRRLQVEARKWMLGKLAPKKYGDKIDLNHGGQAENPLTLLLGEIANRGTKLPIKGND